MRRRTKERKCTAARLINGEDIKRKIFRHAANTC